MTEPGIEPSQDQPQSSDEPIVGECIGCHEAIKNGESYVSTADGELYHPLHYDAAGETP